MKVIYVCAGDLLAPLGIGQSGAVLDWPQNIYGPDQLLHQVPLVAPDRDY